MKKVATYSNIGEALFVQGLLQQEGIESFMPDPSTVPSGVFALELKVHASDYESALAIVRKHQSEKQSVPAKLEHPSSGYPFIGVTLFVALIWMGFISLSSFVFDKARDGFWVSLGDAALTGVLSLIQGIFVGVFVALVGLVTRPVWRKFRKA